MLQTALNWLQKEIAVIPIYYKSKKPALQSWIEYQSQLPTEQQVVDWFSHKFRNLGIVTGWQDLTILDFDSFDLYSLWLQFATVGESALVAQYCACVVSSRGVHIYTKIKNAHTTKYFVDLTNNIWHTSFDSWISTQENITKIDWTNYLVNGHLLTQKEILDTFPVGCLDIKACGGYVLAPPSIHPSGVPYTWLTEGPIVEVSSVEALLPETWLQQEHTEQPTLQTVELDPWELAGSRQQIGMGIIGQIKNRVKITDLIQAEKSSRNGWFKTTCPFHQDTQPSFWIDNNRGLCGCYACGGKPLDVINLYARLNHLDNRQAISLLAERI